MRIFEVVWSLFMIDWDKLNTDSSQCIFKTLVILFEALNICLTHKGAIHKGRPQNFAIFYPPPSPRPQNSAFCRQN